MSNAHVKRGHNRFTGLFAVVDKATGGTKAPVWGCEHYHCSGGGFHSPDCSNAGFVKCEPALNRSGNDLTPARRHAAKKGGLTE